MRLFEIDINRLVVLLMPTFLRKRFNFALVRAMIQPVSTVMSLFEANRGANLYNMKHNGQVCYLRAVLNDAFDVEQRRIRIEDSERWDWTFIYQETEDKPLWLALRQAQEPVLIASDAFTTDEGTDFMVIVPGFDELSQRAIRPQMISLVNYYKLAGMRYSIIFE